MRSSRRLRFSAGLVLALVLGGALMLPTGVAAASGGGTLYVLQGLPTVTADVAVDGTKIGTGVSATTVLGPLRLATGRHVVALSSKGTQLVRASVEVRSGSSVDVLAYWAAETPKMPRIAVLPDDLSPLGRDKTRLVVTHGIAGPPADIYVNGKVLFHSVANGESLSVLVPAGTYTVKALATLSGQTLLPQASMMVRAGTLTRAVAIGAPGMKPDVLVHVLPIPGPVSGDRTPSSVHTGNGGQAAALFAESANRLAGLPRLPFALLSAAFLVLAGSVAASIRRPGAARRPAR
jgi:Domain of unknown function (DUF4397)